ncbi:MAG: NAD(+) diphosphatase [Kiloniellales bacterium]
MPQPVPGPNFYASGGLDRLDERRADAAWLEARLRDPQTRFVAVWRARSLITAESAAAGQPRPAWIEPVQATPLLARASTLALLGRREETHFIALDLSAMEAPELEALLGNGARFRDLREVGPLLPRSDGAVLAYARGLMHWHQNNRFCGLCGSPTESANGGHIRVCRNRDCGRSHFPRTDPAVIMLIHDGGERCVLGRQAAWPPGMHSTLAGFVEPGESLEEAVAREVKEEVGLELRDIAYHSSQPWPFPASLMVGFHARATGSALAVNQGELEAAAWFTRWQLARSPEDERFRLPRRDSIARRLIEDWLAG